MGRLTQNCIIMFHDSGQAIEPTVIERIYAELCGQPGLTSWFGELLTETYTVVFFVEAVDDANRTLYETPYHDAGTGVTVEPVLETTVE